MNQFAEGEKLRIPRKTVVLMLLSVGLVLTGCAGYMMETKKSAEMIQDMPSMILIRDTSLGAVLTDAKGMTLYTFSRDDAGKSNCYEKCAKYWPPLTVEAGDEPVGEFLIVARDDGASQWSHRGQPLYLFALDKQPGDTMGEVAGDVSVAHPSMQ